MDKVEYDLWPHKRMRSMGSLRCFSESCEYETELPGIMCDVTDRKDARTACRRRTRLHDDLAFVHIEPPSGQGTKVGSHAVEWQQYIGFEQSLLLPYTDANA
jgi:hypothetical protein